MAEIIYGTIAVGGGVLIIVGLVGQFYFQRRAMVLRRELWRREDSRAAGTVPYDTDGYENWALPVPETPNVRLYVEKRERPPTDSSCVP